MFGITDLATYLIGTIFIVLLPGPNSLYVLSVAAGRGVKAGYQGAAGVFVGDTVLMVLSATGMAAMLKVYPALFWGLKAAGAAYLGWVGIHMLLSAWRSWRVAGSSMRAAAAVVPATQVSFGNPFRKALTISLLNPKAILFFISFFIQFVDPAYPRPALTFLALGLILQVCSMTYLTAVILIGSRVADSFRQRRRLSAGLSGGVGALFIGFGVKLATASL
ncbi:leucine efflux protein LeuE [Laribacter hongkongensis]|uniref:leucine efflux protein LeuE n=1 Tax=Laribacter hongkongensis TaxID=168471 RepID=UPI001EFE1369|nr:leucine efflux protein LeuE [Laribacter hongkongensis]MCG8993055.1 leucine efflux protein LeuE [Laribacter hongkongensis]MCG8998325.1 leucine efflux protein LeuE [Laribacter hongkongensis]MCG9001550.1 leucine efflux protein LeuE [Laribacter hongkongensis]MCG9003871.1 leucine efflux protein LeuE [Laribacter hongkongensis]MCG9008259.1 leucine efflux protein LeuE [Laribacter hongkongensis]